MMAAKRRRTIWAVAASITAHLAVILVVAAQRPILMMPPEDLGPPPPIIPILILPKTPPPTTGRPAPINPIRLHRRPQRFIPPEAPTAPIAPPAPAPAPPASPSRAPPALHPAPQPEGPKGDVRTALRQSEVGCANQQAVGLNRAERDLCDEKFGKGAKTAPFLGLGLAADKQRVLDAAGAQREADYKYKHGNSVPSANLGGIGASAEDIAKGTGNDKPVAKVPF
jgi:hypothetical protein